MQRSKWVTLNLRVSDLDLASARCPRSETTPSRPRMNCRCSTGARLAIDTTVRMDGRSGCVTGETTQRDYAGGHGRARLVVLAFECGGRSFGGVPRRHEPSIHASVHHTLGCEDGAPFWPASNFKEVVCGNLKDVQFYPILNLGLFLGRPLNDVRVFTPPRNFRQFWADPTFFSC